MKCFAFSANRLPRFVVLDCDRLPGKLEVTQMLCELGVVRRTRGEQTEATTLADHYLYSLCSSLCSGSTAPWLKSVSKTPFVLCVEIGNVANIIWCVQLTRLAKSMLTLSHHSQLAHSLAFFIWLNSSSHAGSSH